MPAIKSFRSYLTSHRVEEKENESQRSGGFEAAVRPETVDSDANRQIADGHDDDDCRKKKQKIDNKNKIFACLALKLLLTIQVGLPFGLQSNHLPEADEEAEVNEQIDEDRGPLDGGPEFDFLRRLIVGVLARD